MKFIDMHCDTLMMAYLKGLEDIYEMPGMLDIKRMKSGNQLAQFFAVFMAPPGMEKYLGLENPIDDDEYIEKSLKIFKASMAKNSSSITPAYNADDILENEKMGKMSGLLTFEDGRPVQGKMENLKKYYDLGIRLITLTWNNDNCFGYPNSKDPEIMMRGLKDFGKEAINYMNELGILIDVSHLSDGGFQDVAALSKKPFVASHSNCRAVSPHQRNLTDEMIKILGEKGGLAGINFGPEFLNEDISCKDSTVQLMVRHIKHFVNIGGIECVGLGSDFDGVSGNMEVSGPDKMHLIFDSLSKDGYSDDQIEKIAYKNAIRILKEAL